MPGPFFSTIPQLLFLPARSRPSLHIGSVFQQHGVLTRVRLLDISLGHLLHHKVAIDLHILDQFSIYHPPFARNREDADWRLGVDETVDAIGGVCEG